MPSRPASWSAVRKPTPSTSRINYALTAAFEDNTLTRDRAMWDFMRRQMTEVPALAIGAPTMQWFGAALAEMRALARRPAPALPCYAALGGRERIVEPAAIHARMKRWPNGTLDLIAGAEHELMMELPEVRMRFYDGVAALFASAGA